MMFKHPHFCWQTIFTGSIFKIKVKPSTGLPAIMLTQQHLSDDTSVSKMFEINEKPSDPRKTELYLVVGLGNHPYPETRHSIGMKAVDRLAFKLGLQWENSQGRHGGFLCKTDMNASDSKVSTAAKVFLFKPRALMNVNGGNVAKTAAMLGVSTNNIYLVHDELDMVVGKCGLKDGGSARGHKGVQSCILSLKSHGLWPKEATTEFKGMPRLRIGIGRPSSKSQVVSYVLSPIPSEELKSISTAIDHGMDLVLKHIGARMTSWGKDGTSKQAEKDDHKHET